MGCMERVDAELVAAMKAQGWGEYLTRATPGNPKTSERSLSSASDGSGNPHVIDDHTYKDGKKVPGLDLGKPGVLEASNLLLRGRKSGVRGRINNLNQNDFASK